MFKEISETQHWSDDPNSLLVRGRNKLYTLWVAATYPLRACGKKMSIHYPCVLSRRAASHVKIGNGVIIRKDTWINVIADSTEGVKVVIEDNCALGYRTSISAKNSIHLGRNVVLAASALIMDHNHAYEDINLPIREQGVTSGGRIRIEEGCWIGHGAAVVCGKGELIIGRNSVIGANAVVTKSFPPYSVVVGSPARIVKQYDTAKGRWVVERSELDGLVGETGSSKELSGACMRGAGANCSRR